MRQIFVICLIAILGCRTHPVEKCKDQYEIAENYFDKYLNSKEKIYLDSCYYFLRKGECLRIECLNCNHLYAMLLYIRKYKELERIVNENKTLEKETKEFVLNQIWALKTFKRDSVKAKGYILDNLKMIKSKLEYNPRDSLYWGDYFSMRIYIVGKKQALKELDSLKKNHKIFSDIFYDYGLKDVIVEYPEEWMFERQRDSL